MATDHALQALLNLALAETDRAARELGRANAEHRLQQGKLDLLLGYREEYQQRLRQGLDAGLNGSACGSYLSFINKLEQAIERQREQTVAAAAHRDGSKQVWAEALRQQRSCEVLLQRRRLQAQRSAARREQKSLDEHSTRKASADRQREAVADPTNR